MYQHVVSADQIKFPAGTQLQEFNFQENSLTDFQKRAFPDSQVPVYNEIIQVTSLSSSECLGIHSTGISGSQRISPDSNQDALPGGQLATLERSHVMFASGYQTPDEYHLVTSVFDQTIQEEDQKMPATGDQMFDCS